MAREKLEKTHRKEKTKRIPKKYLWGPTLALAGALQESAVKGFAFPYLRSEWPAAFYGR